MTKKDETKVEEVVDVKGDVEAEATAIATAEDDKTEGFFKRNSRKIKAAAIVLLAFAAGTAAGRFSTKVDEPEKEESEEPEEEIEETE